MSVNKKIRDMNVKKLEKILDHVSHCEDCSKCMFKVGCSHLMSAIEDYERVYNFDDNDKLLSGDLYSENPIIA